MRKLIPGWVHVPGRHCASTVLSDLTRFYGPDLSEPFCFGLGAGLGFYYLEGDALSPTRMIMTRSEKLEPDFFRNLGLEFSWRTDPDPESGGRAIKAATDSGTPVLLRADIFHLDYYNSKTHFPLHIILFWGHDPEQRTAFVADTGWEGLQEIPDASLSRARYVELPYHRGQGEFFPVVLPQRFKGLVEKARTAMLAQANGLLDQAGPGGISGLRQVAKKIEQWAAAKDASWCFRWAYQIIEKRGTGGGAFRKIYAEFLSEAAGKDPLVSQFAKPEDMARIGERWTELSAMLKDASEKNPVPAQELKKIAGVFRELADREQEFFGRVREKFKQAG
jgi:hypothetical protein